jgi:hypothetical protein
LQLSKPCPSFISRFFKKPHMHVWHRRGSKVGAEATKPRHIHRFLPISVQM